MPRQRRVVRVAARGQVGRRNQGSGTVHDHVGRDEAFAVHDARPFRDFLTRLRDDREPDAAAIARSIFFPTFPRISEDVGVEMMHVSEGWSINSPIFSKTRVLVTVGYTSRGSPFQPKP